MATVAGSGEMLLDDVRTKAARLGYSRRTAKAYTYWIRRFILFHPPSLASRGPLDGERKSQAGGGL